MEYLREKGERPGRNPKTGEEVRIPAKRTPFFKVGKELKEKVDETRSPQSEKVAAEGALG